VAVISIKGMEIVEQTTSPDLSLQRRGDGDEEFVILKVAAGEVWDEVVQFAVENNLQGIEALSAIPGSAGAAPVQNIGAYGTEIKDVLEKVEAVERATGEAKEFTNSECEFTYRNSIFKNKLKDKFIITHIYLKLKKSKYAKLPEYKDVKEYFKDSGKESASLTEIRRAITEIRWCKLPRPEDLGNVGSFFHNPIIFLEQLEILKEKLPNIPVYKVDEEKVKVPAGYLIDQLGLKGLKSANGKVGTYEKNALVLVNYGGAEFSDLEDFVKFVQQKVSEAYDINLVVEPELVI
jgi:UDP-N-acetylmuramate dehydrogenase